MRSKQTLNMSYFREGTGSLRSRRVAGQNRSERTVRLPTDLYRFAWGLIALMLTCFILNLLCGTFLHLYEPYATPLFTEYFPDFVLLKPRFQHFHTPEFFTFPGVTPFMYPAPVAVVYEMFYLVPAHPLRTFLLFGLAAFVAAGILFGRLLRQRGVRPVDAFIFPFVVLLCSYPFWFAGKQANMEIVIWVIVAAGLALFLNGRGYSAATCFGFAASMKIYPIIYLGLLLVRRQYRQVIVGVLTATLATVASLWAVYPRLLVSSQRISAGVEQFRFLYMLHVRPEIGADHSLFAVFKLALPTLPPPRDLGKILSIYLAVAAIGGLVLFVFRIRKLPVLNQVLCLVIASILFPPTSFEYTLLHLFDPFAMYVLLIVTYRREGRRVPGLKFLLPCFAVLLGFIPELIRHHVSFGGQVKSVLLLALFVYALFQPLASLSEEAISWNSRQESMTS